MDRRTFLASAVSAGVAIPLVCELPAKAKPIDAFKLVRAFSKPAPKLNIFRAVQGGDVSAQLGLMEKYWDDLTHFMEETTEDCYYENKDSWLHVLATSRFEEVQRRALEHPRVSVDACGGDSTDCHWSPLGALAWFGTPAIKWEILKHPHAGKVCSLNRKDRTPVSIIIESFAKRRQETGEFGPYGPEISEKPLYPADFIQEIQSAIMDRDDFVESNGAYAIANWGTPKNLHRLLDIPGLCEVVKDGWSLLHHMCFRYDWHQWEDDGTVIPRLINHPSIAAVRCENPRYDDDQFTPFHHLCHRCHLSEEDRRRLVNSPHINSPSPRGTAFVVLVESMIHSDQELLCELINDPRMLEVAIDYNREPYPIIYRVAWMTQQMFEHRKDPEVVRLREAILQSPWLRVKSPKGHTIAEIMEKGPIYPA